MPKETLTLHKSIPEMEVTNAAWTEFATLLAGHGMNDCIKDDALVLPKLVLVRGEPIPVVKPDYVLWVSRTERLVLLVAEVLLYHGGEPNNSNSTYFSKLSRSDTTPGGPAFVLIVKMPKGTGRESVNFIDEDGDIMTTSHIVAIKWKRIVDEVSAAVPPEAPGIPIRNKKAVDILNPNPKEGS